MDEASIKSIVGIHAEQCMFINACRFYLFAFILLEKVQRFGLNLFEKDRTTRTVVAGHLYTDVMVFQN